MLPNLPQRGVVLLHGNTLDVYWEEPLIPSLLKQVRGKRPIVGLSPDRGFQVMVAEAAAAKRIKERVAPCLELGGGGPFEAFHQTVTQENCVGFLDIAEAYFAAEKWEAG